MVATTPAVPTSLTIDDGWSRPQPTPSANGTAPQVTPVTAVATYTVQRGDSVFSIAAELANHDEQRTWDVADEILDLNLDATMADGQRFSNPAYLKPGWVLRLPANFASAAVTADAVAAPSDVGESDVHVVVPGDTLWDIAEDELGSGIEWSQIWQENAGADMGAGRTFDDPDLILPGWELELPDDDSAAVPPLSDTDAPAEASVPPPAEPPSATIVAAPAEPGQLGPGTVDSPWAEPTVVEATTPSTTAPSTSSSTTALPNVGDATASDNLPGRTSAPDAPSPIRLEHAAMLAAGILMLVGVRRRQRLRAATPRSRVPEPRREVVDTELLLRRIDPGERAARIDVACRSAASALVDTDVQIVAMQVSPEGEIALTLSGVAAPSAPWTGDGNLWHLAAGVPIELLGEAARRVGMPCVAFVQLGIDHDGSDVLVDLEAAGTLAIDAQPGQADAVVRGVAAGLATSLYAEVAHLITVSMPNEVLLGHRNAHRADSVDAAFELAASLVGSTSQNERSSFELRSLRTGGEMWEPAIVLMNDHDGAEHADGLQFPVPGHGIAVVAAVGPNGLPDAPARLSAESDEWILTVAGRSIAMTPIGLDRADVDAVLAILHDAEQPLIWMDDVPSEFSAIEPAPVDASIAADPHDVPATLEHDAPAADDFEPMAHAVVVTLFGGVEVGSADGTVATWERSKTVELIAWLATHRSHSTRAAGAHGALGTRCPRRDVRQCGVRGAARAGAPRATARRRGVVGAHAHRAAPAAPVGGERRAVDRATPRRMPGCSHLPRRSRHSSPRSRRSTGCPSPTPTTCGPTPRGSRPTSCCWR